MSEFAMSGEQLKNYAMDNIDRVTPEDAEEFGWVASTELGVFRCVDGGDETEDACDNAGLWESALNVPDWTPECYCGRPAYLVELVLN